MFDLILDLLKFVKKPLLFKRVNRTVELLALLDLLVFQQIQFFQRFLVDSFVYSSLSTPELFVFLHLEPSLLDSDVILFLVIQLVHESCVDSDFVKKLILSCLDVVIDQTACTFIGICFGFVFIYFLTNLVNIGLNSINLFFNVFNLFLDLFLLPVLQHLLQSSLLPCPFISPLLFDLIHPFAHFLQQPLLFPRILRPFDLFHVLLPHVSNLLVAFIIELFHLSLKLVFAFMLQSFSFDAVFFKLVFFQLEFVDLLLG